ncbi:uncharacterized protein LOC117115558 [Anneissia japonica]|uniref:uncharacterized protein LOC117115558 n=1 Tax=Anneissia japonica TaxID=1529436 RepID=UPI00142572FC|nr:uncharacterized protein LOC117115558 [Anneissia japonica]
MGSCAAVHYKVAIVLTGVVTLVMLIIMCIVYVHPYNKTKDFEEGECTVLSHYIKILYDKECNCYQVDDSSYSSTTYCDYGDFECLKIFVSFFDNQRNRTALLYESDKSFASDSECSYPVCDTYDPDYIYTATGKYKEDQDYLNFRDKYTETGASFYCHYHPVKAEAIIQRLVTKKQAISSTLGTLCAGAILMALIALACVIWRRN